MHSLQHNANEFHELRLMNNFLFARILTNVLKMTRKQANEANCLWLYFKWIFFLIKWQTIYVTFWQLMTTNEQTCQHNFASSKFPSYQTLQMPNDSCVIVRNRSSRSRLLGNLILPFKAVKMPEKHEVKRFKREPTCKEVFGNEKKPLLGNVSVWKILERRRIECFCFVEFFCRQQWWISHGQDCTMWK